MISHWTAETFLGGFREPIFCSTPISVTMATQSSRKPRSSGQAEPTFNDMKSMSEKSMLMFERLVACSTHAWFFSFSSVVLKIVVNLVEKSCSKLCVWYVFQSPKIGFSVAVAIYTDVAWPQKRTPPTWETKEWHQVCGASRSCLVDCSMKINN